MAKAGFENLLKEVSTFYRLHFPRRKRLGYGKFIAVILLALSLFLTATAQTKRVVAIKVDGLPYELVERFAHERDPLTGKSLLPWFDHIFFQNGTRITNFYVRGTSLSAPSWSVIDTGQHLQIKGNVEFDRATLYSYDYLAAMPFYAKQALGRDVDMPGTEVLDTLGIHPLMDAYDDDERLTSFQLYQRGARLRTLQRAGEERFVKDPRRLVTDLLLGLDMNDIVYNELERELVEKLSDPRVRYLDLLTGKLDHAVHHNNDRDSHLFALKQLDGLVGRVWTAIQKSAFAGETALVIVSDHGFNTDERIFSQGFNLVRVLGSAGGGGHHVVTKRRLLLDYSIKGVYPFTPLVTTTTQQSYYLKGQSTDYPTALLDFDGNERAGLHLRNNHLNVLHLMLQQLQRKDLSPQLNQAWKDAFFVTLDRARRRWQGDLDQLTDELGALHKDIRTQRELWASQPKKFTEAEKETGKDDQVRRVYARILQLEEFERRYQNDYLAPMKTLLSISPKNFDPTGIRIEAVIPKNAMGPRNTIHDLQNYVVGLGRDGLVLKTDGSLDLDRSFLRLDYFDLLRRQTVRNNVQPGVSNHPIDFIATRIPRQSIATALSAELQPDDDVVWLYGGANRQALILARSEASGQLQLRYLPIANLTQDAQGLIRFDVTEWRPDLPLRILEDPRLDAPGTDRVAWLSDWHTDVEWLHALHKTQYSNGLIGLHEQFTIFPAPGIDASERGLSRDEQLLRQFCRRRRQAVETDLLILASNHWNFDVRGFNPGGNHGSFFRISTHSTLMFAGGERTGIPRGLAVTEPYDSLSVVPTILALTGNLQSDNQPVENLVKRGFLKFPGRVIPEVAGQNFGKASADSQNRRW